MNFVQPPETVRAYLAELRRALKGAAPGLISDALADCEEHLNMEIAQNPEMDEAAVMASVVETYGSPQEIAEEYRDMEAAISTPFPQQQTETTESRPRGFFNVISDPRTYGALLYMLLSLITGIFYFTWTITGIALTASFTILIIGIPFALLFIGSIRMLSHVEGRIVESLLGVRMPRRLPATTAPDESIWARIKAALVDLRTWTSMFYLLLMLPLGVIYFTVGLTGLVTSLALIGASIYCLITGDTTTVFNVNGGPYWLAHIVHTAPGLVLVAFIGLLLFFLVLHLARIIGWLHGKIAEGLLVRR